MNAHVPGERDQAAQAVAPWSGKDMDGVLSSLKRVLDAADQCADCPARTAIGGGTTSAFVKRAARLHADIAVMHKTARGCALPSNGETTRLTRDGQAEGVSAGTIHWEVGRRLLDFVRPAASRDEDVRLWYRATTAFLQEHNEFYELEPHLARARTLFPNDGSLLLAAGALHEGYAEDRVQVAFAPAASQPLVALPGRTLANIASEQALAPAAPRPASIRSRMEELGQAERLLRQALATDPTLAEARIRLGHVLASLRRETEAVSELQRALEAPLPPLLRYYAELFLGQSEQSLGKRDAAVTAFDAAAAIFPGAQSPHLALSELAAAAGDEPRARRELEVLAQPAERPERDDPWWKYNRIHVPDAAAQFERLRTATFQ